jgi:peptidylprolyl isomerase
MIHLMRTLALSLFATVLCACSSASKVDDEIVAQIEGVAITVRALQARAPALAQGLHDELAMAKTDADKRSVLLRALLKEEAALREARRLGYDRRPEVVNGMVGRMLHELVLAEDKPAQLPDDDIARYYVDHREELVRPELVRVLQVLCGDRTVAEQVTAKARAAEKTDIDTFQKLATQYSQDSASRAMGGDMGFIDAKTSHYPEPVLRAAFALRGLFEISDPIESPLGFHVLKLVQRLPAHVPTLAEATPGIRAKLRWLLLERKKHALSEKLLERAKVDIDIPVLVKVPFPSDILVPKGAPGSSHPRGLPAVQ